MSDIDMAYETAKTLHYNAAWGLFKLPKGMTVPEIENMRWVLRQMKLSQPKEASMTGPDWP